MAAPRYRDLRTRRRSAARLRRLAGEALEDRALLTGTPRLVADLNPTPVDVIVTDYLTRMAALGGSVYFTGGDTNAGYGLWKSDGTSEGTSLVERSTTIQGLTAFRGSLIFAADGGLWKSDGTAGGTILLSTVKADLYFKAPVEVDGTLFFVAGRELWKTNGTAAGTVRVKSFAAGVNSYDLNFVSVDSLTNVNGTLFFIGNDGHEKGTRVWKSDGTQAGTVIAADIDLGYTVVYHPTLINVNGTLFLGAQNDSYSQLWKLNGTQGAPALLKSMYGYERAFTNVGGTLFFTVGSSTGDDLWKSDGSAEGTVFVKAQTYASRLRAVGNSLFFVGSGGQLWTSDGSADGTVSLTAGLNDLGQLKEIGGELFFFEDASSFPKLWKSDGTASGTVLVSSLASSGISGPTYPLTQVGGKLFFAASDGTQSSVLWTSDGTSAGTHPVPAPGNRTGDSLNRIGATSASIGNVVYFAGSDGEHGTELWRTDGTAAGTLLVRDIVPGQAGSAPFGFTNVNGTLYFVAYDAGGRDLVWKSDGTADGTQILKDFPIGISISGIQAVNGTLVFALTHPHLGGTDDPWSGLWTSDGTAEGTIRIAKTTGPTMGLSGEAGGVSYFSAWNYDHCSSNFDCWDVEPWRTDGTAAGTYQLKEIKPPGVFSFDVDSFAAVGPVEFFFTRYFANGTENRALWKTDGTRDGTVLVSDFTPGTLGDLSGSPTASDFDQTLFFTLNDGVYGVELWKSDGTPEGTGMVKDISPDSGNSDVVTFVASQLHRGDGRVFFWADDGVHGGELWTSDGTAEGTKLVKDIRPGAESSNLSMLTSVNGTAYFAVNDGVHGTELWRSDGTEAGTFETGDIAPGAASSSPAWFWNGSNSVASMPLMFSADDGVHGCELWKLIDINAAPSFRLGSDLNATDTSGRQEINGFASEISAGPPDETRQQVHFVLTNTNPDLFTVLPAIDAAGKLTFEPAVDLTGSAEISIVLVDDGGTANGGVDQSYAQTFTIEVTLALPWHNREMAPDVTGDGEVVGEDVLDLINYINAFGSRPVDANKANGNQALVAASQTKVRYYDVTGDDYIAADDVITVINYINAKPNSVVKGEGEASVTGNGSQEAGFRDQSTLEALLIMLAADTAPLVMKRK